MNRETVGKRYKLVSDGSVENLMLCVDEDIEWDLMQIIVTSKNFYVAVLKRNDVQVGKYA